LNLRLRIPDWILLLAFCAFFFFWRLNGFGLIGADEPRYAQVAREMFERRDWITPTLGGSPWLEKPPLYYWQAMVAYRIFGVSDWAARLPSAFDASLLVFAVYWFLRRFRGWALDGALMLACSAGIVGYARAASTDMPLAATFTMGMISWFAWLDSERRRYLLLSYASLGLAMLAKGPVAPFLAAAMVVIFAAATRTRKILGRSLSLSGVLVFSVVTLPWYVLVEMRNPQFLRVFILEHNLARFSTNLFHHPEPFWYFIPVTLLGWVPWTVFAVVALVSVVRRIRSQELDSFNTFLLIWIVVVVVFFSISKSKLPGYVLPAIPAGILLLANYLRERATAKPHWILLALHGAISAALLFAALVMPAVVFRHRLLWDRSDILPVLVAIAAGIGVATAGIRKLRVSTAVPAVLALAVVLRLAAPALNQTLSVRAVSDALARVSPAHLPVATVLVSRETEYGLAFYRDQKLPENELRQPIVGEHLIVAHPGLRETIVRALSGRQIRYLGSFPAQKLEFFYVSP